MTVIYNGNEFDVEFYVKNGLKDYRLFETLIDTLCEINSPRKVIVELFIEWVLKCRIY